MRYLLLIAIFITSDHLQAQIVLEGYKCKYYKDQVPYIMSEMYNKNDTFRFTNYGRDLGGDNPKQDLKDGLELCFGHEKYTKTKDNLYIVTGTNKNLVYYYEIYDPIHTASLSVRSNNNDSLFSQNSKWLLAQIRQHRKGDIFFENEKGQNCQDPNDPSE